MILIDYDYKGRFIIENLEIMKMKVKINNLNTQHFKNFYLVFFFSVYGKRKEMWVSTIESSVLIN